MRELHWITDDDGGNNNIIENIYLQTCSQYKSLRAPGGLSYEGLNVVG